MRQSCNAIYPKLLAFLVTAFLLPGTATPAQTCSTERDPATHTKLGDQMPSFTVTDSSGKTFALASQRGKVVLINFWATWCGPCQFEIPRIEKEIWQKYKSVPNFTMVAIAREQTDADIVPFRQKNGFTFPIASDPQRSTYALFADSGIPRTYVVDAQGKILFQTVGFCSDDFDRIRKEVDKALAKAPK